MILWFLRLFRAFTDLEMMVQMQARKVEEFEHHVQQLLREKQEIQTDLIFCRNSHNEISTEKLRLQDRLDAALADKEQLWATMQEALSSERNALRMQVNHAVQKSGGGIPYPDSHSLPLNAAATIQEPGPVGRRGRLLPSEMAARQTQRVIGEYVTSMTPAAKST